MDKKVGRNDPCPCGSGKKYKACCALKEQKSGTKKFTAKLIGGATPVKAKNLIEQTFSFALSEAKLKEPYHQPSPEEIAAEVPVPDATNEDEDPISSSPI